MAPTVADRVFLDTNVLLAATDTGRAEHVAATAALEQWPARGVQLYGSGQVLREYLVVATRPSADNGLGLDQTAAIENVQALRQRVLILDEDQRVAVKLLDLLADVACVGKQIHDANVVATMIVHGIETIATSNLSDFRRFVGQISVIDLA